jgi:outer membrane protein TolC
MNIRIALIVVLVIAFVAPAGAQSPSAQPQQTSPAAGQGQAGSTLPLTMDQAVAMALEANLGLKSERLNLDQASNAVAGARTTFLPFVQTSFGRQTAKFVPSDFTQGASDLSSSGLSVSGAVSQNLRWFGGSYSVSWSGSRSTQIGGISSFNPRLGSSLRVDFAQPLLRGLRTDAARVGLANAQRRRAITDVVLEQRIVATEASVRLAYLNLVAAIEGLKVARLNMEIVQQSLRQSRARVAVGQSPQIEIIQAEAQVASNQEQVIVAEASISTTEDALRSLILDPARPDFWTVRLVPTDAIEIEKREVNLDESIKTALANRLDLSVLKREMEITDVNLALTRDNLLPDVNFNLSYSAAGTAGTQFTFGSGFPPPIVDTTTRTFGSALGDVFGGAYPSWGIGVSVSYPLGRSAQQVAHAQTQITKRQQEISLRELELEIVRQVREAVRQVENSFQRVQAAQAFRQAAEQQLEAEERRFAVGLSTTLERQVRQSELARARTSELNAMIFYARALIVLDRVQRTQ